MKVRLRVKNSSLLQLTFFFSTCVSRHFITCYVDDADSYYINFFHLFSFSFFVKIMQHSMRSLCILRDATVQKLRNQWMDLTFPSGYVKYKRSPLSRAVFGMCFDSPCTDAALYTLSYFSFLTLCPCSLRKLAARTVVIWGQMLTFVYSEAVFRLVYRSRVSSKIEITVFRAMSALRQHSETNIFRDVLQPRCLSFALVPEVEDLFCLRNAIF